MKYKFYLIITLFFFPVQNIYSLTLHRVILATDTNPTYLEFWPLAAKMWKEITGLQPTLAFIAPPDVYIDESLGDVIRFEPVDGVPTSLQAQAIRHILPILFEDDGCIISDIDMIPLQKNYFIDSVLKCPENSFVVYRDAAYWGTGWPQYPMCYLAAKGCTFKDLFGCADITDWPALIRQWQSYGFGWNTDERMVYLYLHSWKDYFSRCVTLGHGVGPRVDRIAWHYDVGLLQAGYYIDAHLLRPYSEYKDQIDTLVYYLNYHAQSCS